MAFIFVGGAVKHGNVRFLPALIKFRKIKINFNDLYGGFFSGGVDVGQEIGIF